MLPRISKSSTPAGRWGRSLPVEDILVEAKAAEDLLAGTEASLGPALEKTLFPGGAPAVVDLEMMVSALARSIDALAAAHGVARTEDDDARLEALRDAAARLEQPPISSERAVGAMLRAMRTGARRQREDLEERVRREGIDRASAGQSAGSLLRLVRLWSLAATWHSIAAHQIDARAGVLFDAIADQWAAREDAVVDLVSR